MLDFDAASHTYTINGIIVPSVTTIIRPLYDFSAIPPGVLQRKAEIGQAVHLACELDDEDDLDDSTLDPLIAGYVAGWRRFKSETRATILMSERQLGSPVRMFAGTLDRLIKINSETWMIDIKTTVSLSPAVGVQTAGYNMLLAENDPAARMCPPKRGAVQLLNDGSYRFKEYTDPADVPTFQALLITHQWKAKHGIETFDA